MSLSELEASYSEVPDGPPEDRLPPQDVAAEQSALGSMLLSKDAIADCVETLKAHDFYRPAHESIYEAVLDLYARGEPVDAVTVSDELTKRGDLARVGGTAYLYQLINGVPTAANASYYAEIVAERAVLRRLVEAGTRIVQMGYAQGGGDVDDIVNLAQAEVYGVADKRGGEDYHALAALLEPTMDEIEHAAGTSGEMLGVPTGFTDLDELTNGLHPGQMIIVAARPAVGKALALDTPLVTPDGWTTMGEVVVGDQLIGADGRPTTVVAATEVMADRPCFEVEFSDGSVIVADAEHLWRTSTRLERRGLRDVAASVRSTREIAETVRCATADARLNHSVSLTKPLDLAEADLPLPPYVLGVWLGDGESAGARFASADSELVMHLEAAGWCSDTDDALLRKLGLEHIPSEYLRASEEQRRALLGGLLDADGAVTEDGCLQFTSRSEDLAASVHELILSLGYLCDGVQQVRGHSPEVPAVHTLTFSSDEDVFRLESKKLVHKERRDRTFQRRDSLFITAARPVPSVPVRCVQVDNEDHLYLAGQSMIPTHNSTLALDIARAAAIKHELATVVFSLEMSRTEITMRLLSAESEIPLQNMRKGTMRDQDWAKIAETQGRIHGAPLFIDDSPNMSLMEIRAKCRRLKQRHNLKLVIVDYLQLMSSGKRVESRQQEVAEFSRALKLLAKELEVPVIALSQLNRGPEQRTDKKPQMSDLRESGCLTADTRVLRADTGAQVTLGELHAAGERDIPVWALDDSLRYVRRHVTHVFSTGQKPVFRMTLASGKTIRATENHRFLTYDGWRQLGDLRTGDRLAVPRHVPAPDQHVPWSDDDQVTALARDLTTGRVESIPVSAWHMSKRQIALLVASFWEGAGRVHVGRAGEVSISVRGQQGVLDEISRLLLRFGISGRTVVGPPGRAGLHVTDRDDQRRFLREIAPHAQLGARVDDALTIVSAGAGAAQPRQVLTDPSPLWQEMARVVAESSDGGSLATIADALDDEDLDLEAVNDVTFDPIEIVEFVGVEEVFDATVVGVHNFVANGIAVHNSIEQDADVVILLHRESMYERESPREGEADVIVAKHRNGPTDTIVVAFQGHYSRFTNMANSF